jgi:hypothetical protein
LSIWVWVIVVGVVCSAAQGGRPAGEQYMGTWMGTWEGAGATGGFELTLEKDKDKTEVIGGRVSVTGEPTYQATLKTVAFDGPKMTATYNFPPEPSVEVRLACVFEGGTAKGTWSAFDAGGNEVLSGTWTVKKQEAPGMIRHTVAFRLRHPDGSPAERAFLEEGRRVLSAIPGVRNFELLREVSRKNGFTFGFSMEFTDQAAYDAYSNHPDHNRFVEERWKREVEEFMEIDYLPYGGS